MKNKYIDFKVITYFVKCTKNIPENVFTTNSNRVGPYWAVEKAYWISDDKRYQLKTSPSSGL